MKPAIQLMPAPKRGHYNRALSRHERQAAQQARVLAAVGAVAALGREPSIAAVVERAGIGRNTFYEYFDDIEHALSAINARARRELVLRVEPALRQARTPLERMRSLARAWSESVSVNPALGLLALRAQPRGRDAAELSGLGRYVATLLANETEARSALPGLADRARVTAVASVFDAVSRVHLTELAHSAEGTATSDLPRVLAELALRLLR